MPEEFFESDAPVEVLSSTASERKLHLSDGTTVWLNNGAKLKYPASFEADNRTVYLEGEAYFEVRHQAGRPFYVRTDNGIVKEYGTSFNVNRNKPQHHRDTRGRLRQRACRRLHREGHHAGRASGSQPRWHHRRSPRHNQRHSLEDRNIQDGQRERGRVCQLSGRMVWLQRSFPVGGDKGSKVQRHSEPQQVALHPARGRSLRHGHKDKNSGKLHNIRITHYYNNIVLNLKERL